MASNQKPPTAATLAKVVAELCEQVKDLQAADQNQQVWYDTQKKRCDRLAETDDTIDTFLSQTHGQLQQLQARCDEVLPGLVNEEVILDLRSRIEMLEGELRGAEDQLLKEIHKLTERQDLMCDHVSREGWRDRLGRWRWNFDQWRYRMRHRETRNDDCSAD